MRLHIEQDGRSTTMAIVVDSPDALIADLAEALSLPADRIHVDGVPVGADQRIADARIVEGSRISTDPTARADELLVVSAGPDAGASVSLLGNEVVVGRSPEAGLEVDNPSVSARHLVVDRTAQGLTVRDLASHNGTWVDGEALNESEAPLELNSRIRIGSSVVECRRLDTSDRPVGASPNHADDQGRVLFNRPPRSAIPQAPQAVSVPAPPPERTKPVFSMIALLAPIAMAVVMVAVLRRPEYAIFALLSPLMMVGNHVAARRRLTRERSDDAFDHDEAVQRFEAEIAGAQAEERARRRSLGIDLGEVGRRAELPSQRLWERRSGDSDAMTVRLGRGSIEWQAPLDRDNRSPGTDSDDVEATLRANSQIDDVELLADLRTGALGVVGADAQSASILRNVIAQLAVAHGPADLRIAILTSTQHLHEWTWAQWLPHVVQTSGGSLVLAGTAADSFATTLLRDLEEADTSRSTIEIGQRWLIVVDDVALIHGRSSPARRLLARSEAGMHGIVRADTEDQLPAAVSTIARVDASDGSFIRREPGTTAVPETGVADLPSVSTVERIALALARFEDPEQAIPGGSLPQTLRAGELWSGSLSSTETLRSTWRAAKSDSGLRVIIGIGEAGPVSIDLVGDGPHGLVAGTTGAGKSEFLRSLVAGLAVGHDPDDLVFVLIDYKGGSAFDRCSDLPHVVGMVTDLDDHLAERALISLEAELHRREQVLRSVAATDIIEYRSQGNAAGPMPRLVVVIDEFATLRSELPEFVSALIGVAQRGRSLGVHLILATQRPSGAVDANIKANTNLRVALRVQDTTDSTDVIDTGVAADISRSTPGRAWIRRGNADLTAVQTAYVSGPVQRRVATAVRTAPVPLGDGQPPQMPAITTDSDLSELDELVGLVVEAADSIPPPRRPWLDDVEPTVDAGQISSLESIDECSVVLAVADDPERQRHVAAGWSPEDGAMVAFGALGSGVTTLVRSAIAQLSTGVAGRPVWVFAADHGAGGLAGLEEWPHVACVLDPTEVARHERLLVMLGDLLDTRRALSREELSTAPLVVLAIDGIAGFTEVAQVGAGEDRADLFNKIVRDGPAVGIAVLGGAGRSAEVPRTLLAAMRQQFVLELADTNEYGALGIRRRAMPTFRPGRTLIGDTGLVAQVVDWEQTLTADEATPPKPAPPSVDMLSDDVARHELADRATVGTSLRVPYAIDDRTRAAAAFTLRPGEHLLVAGPARSGRTTTLSTIARQLRDADPAMVLVAVSPTGTGGVCELDVFDATGTVDELEHVLSTATTDERPWVVLVEDADRIEDAEVLETIARSARPGLHVIAAVRSTAARSMYTHWTRHVRASGIGLILQPDNGADGELLGVRLPRGERLPAIAGRGYDVATGQVRVVQVAR